MLSIVVFLFGFRFYLSRSRVLTRKIYFYRLEKRCYVLAAGIQNSFLSWVQSRVRQMDEISEETREETVFVEEGKERREKEKR
jgi:hypothetical protein